MGFRLSPSNNLLTRREFLKLSSAGTAGLLGPRLSRSGANLPVMHGRVLELSAIVYDQPSIKGKVARLVWFDSVLPITGATVGDDPSDHNRIWYRVGEEGYMHSSFLQPVHTLLNTPNSEIPEGGVLAEITVPFTDAYWGPGSEYEVAYRYYYQTTCWVIGVQYDRTGTPWYETIEDKWEYILYMPSAHLRLVLSNEIKPLSHRVPDSAKRLEVRTSEQVLIAYEWEKPVFMTRISSGAKFRDGDYSTQPGRFITFHKRPTRHMARGNLAANGYDLPGVPWVTYFTEEGAAFHGTYWHNDFGKPRSHGCINLTSPAAKWVYLWSNPFVPAAEQKVYGAVGTRMDII